MTEQNFNQEEEYTKIEEKYPKKKFYKVDDLVPIKSFNANKGFTLSQRHDYATMPVDFDNSIKYDFEKEEEGSKVKITKVELVRHRKEEASEDKA